MTPAEVQDSQPALDAENVVGIEDQRIRAYVPLSEVGRRPGLFDDTGFADDAAADVYRCPGDATRRFISRCERTQRRVYEAPPTSCRACALRAQCTTSRRGRRVGRGFDEEYLDRVRGYHATEPYAKAMRKRKVWVEPLFAEAKDWHGLRQFRLRGLAKVNGEALMIAAGQNLKRLLSRCGWGRHPWPYGTGGRTTPAAKPVAVPLRQTGRCHFALCRCCSVPHPTIPFSTGCTEFDTAPPGDAIGVRTSDPDLSRLVVCRPGSIEDEGDRVPRAGAPPRARRRPHHNARGQGRNPADRHGQGERGYDPDLPIRS